MNIFISGGCKNGKSYYAQELAKKQGEDKALYYVATMEAVDEEDEKRILRHQGERAGWGFETIEKGRNICDIQADFKGSFLLDSVTALLSNEMFRKDGTIDKEAYKQVCRDLLDFAEKTDNAVFVSDYIYSDAMDYEELTEAYRYGLAYIDRRLAAKCHVVLEVSYGHVQVHKGELNL